MMGWHWSWWAWTVMTLAMLAGWGALFWLLAGRLASGEIDVDEYQRRIDVLHVGTEAGAR